MLTVPKLYAMFGNNNASTTITVLRLVQKFEDSRSVLTKGILGMSGKVIINFNNRMTACRQIGGGHMLKIIFHH